jgi:Flp pilus assembly protein TadG
MKRLPIPISLSRHLRRSQRGQSILLLAFAFIALIAFVGLVTDVALLFTRYAALRRAVDAAAIAAASQVREGTNYATLTFAAEQYIELHNLDSRSTLVETCETDIYQWRAGLGPWEGDPHPESADPWTCRDAFGNPRKCNVSEMMPATELCDWTDPRKLVRVSAQIESPTTFLALIGIESIILDATSVGETAVLDVALVIDISESMSQETNSTHYTAIGATYGGGGPRTIRPDCYTTPQDLANGVSLYARERWAGCCNDPGTGSVSDGTVRRSTGGFLPNGHIWHDANFNNVWDPGEDGLASTVAQSSSLTDPNGFNFTTLICQPFKQVKDAARLFIKRLDFVRGDRVVLVTFDRAGVAYDPDGVGPLRPLLRSEQTAIDALNQKVGVWVNPNRDRLHNICQEYVDSQVAWNEWLAQGANPALEPERRPFAYESLAPCGITNIGGGILAASNALTDPDDVRRDAIWVMVVLGDGAANATNRVPDATGIRNYGYYGFCPWWTFCNLNPNAGYVWPECTENNPSQLELARPVCNDNDPLSRHFCMDWTTNEPEEGNPQCGVGGRYDADDYARDMADFAGLIEIQPNIPGNFIAMFSIGFGREVVEDPTAAPVLRYIADAGDNGFIDNNLQHDLREDRNSIPTYPIGGPYPDTYGEPDVCENTPTRTLHPTQQCGQYYFAADQDDLDAVFEDIASRMFTRLSR